MKLGRLVWLLSIFAAIALFAAACGSDDESDDAADTGTDATEDTATPTEEATEAESQTESTEPTTETDGQDEEEDASEGNTASFRGVTEDTIKVGIAVPDFLALQEAGLPTYYGDYDVAYQALFDKINAEGGIHGRQIEAYYAGFDWLRSETQDAACTQLTEDDEVFIVLSGLLSTSNLCFTELHDTMLMSGYLTEEHKERSEDTLWLQIQAIEGAAIEVLATAMADSGELDGKTIGIVALGALDEGEPGRQMQAMLSDLGYDSDLAITSAPIDDEVAGDAELTTIAERFKSDGVDLVFLLTGGAGPYEPFALAGFEPQIVDRSLGESTVSSADTSYLDGVYGVGGASAEDVWNDPDFQERCVDPVLEANPELEDEFAEQPTDSEQQADGIPNWFVSISIACNHTTLLKELGEIAGANLTNDTFLAALDELGTFTLPTGTVVSFRSEDKWDGQDEFRIVRWNEAEQSLETVGDPIALDR